MKKYFAILLLTFTVTVLYGQSTIKLNTLTILGKSVDLAAETPLTHNSSIVIEGSTIFSSKKYYLTQKPLYGIFATIEPRHYFFSNPKQMYTKLYIGASMSFGIVERGVDPHSGISVDAGETLSDVGLNCILGPNIGYVFPINSVFSLEISVASGFRYSYVETYRNNGSEVILANKYSNYWSSYEISNVGFYLCYTFKSDKR